MADISITFIFPDYFITCDFSWVLHFAFSFGFLQGMWNYFSLFTSFQQNTLIRLHTHTHTHTHTHIIILHYSFSDMFWLSHHQGSTIQGFIDNIWVYVYISECNSRVPPSTRYCNSRHRLASSTLVPCI